MVSHALVPLLLLGTSCGGGVEVSPVSGLPRAADLTAPPDPEPMALVPPASPAWERRPLLRLRHRCAERRTPRLAGGWALGCDALGRVAVAERLSDGLEVELAQPATRVGTAPGRVGADWPGVTWRLPDPTPTSAGWQPATDVVASPAFDGEHLILSKQDRIETYRAGEQVLRSREAAPMPWFPPAQSWPTVLWVDSRDQDVTGLDLWRWDVEGGAPLPWVIRPGDQRHVVAADGWAAWLDDEGVWLERLADGARWLHRAEVGFRAPPSLWHGVVCWEERDRDGIDLACSDGLRVDGADDQGWPSRWGPWLLYREGDDTWLATAHELTVTADDPRIQPREDSVGFRLVTAWPASGWCAEVQRAGAWEPAGAVPTGDATWEVPGDALRLRPVARGTPCAGEALLAGSASGLREPSRTPRSMAEDDP